ncbi:FxSxx-COOH system tetratricopeptide repeat protein [Streptomyces sp. NPDC050264]|uniref:FxSxx-COOH system tetratricopeptide repeat protein n=1 Tax=Streptomyces sp. NPDC050264 TaxID=3155038 RepID=UPI0034288A81
MAEHITISHAGSSRPWAAWISHQLEQQGISTSMLRWDPAVETSLVEALTGLLDAPGRVLLVLDDWYFGLGPRPMSEWADALREVVPARSERFAAVNVASGALPATAAALVPVDLLGLDAREARRRLLRRLGVERSRHVDDENGGPRFPNDDQAQWNVPPRNERFTGRDALLEKIHSVFADSGEGERCVLRGISGVGKTQIAREYAYRFRNEYDIVWQVNSGYPGTAREQLAELAIRLDLPAGRETGDRIRAVQGTLRGGRPYRNWLLIFDGADSVEGIEALLPDGPGHVLITTLTRDWAAFSRTQEIEVQPFTRRESVAFVSRRAPRLTPVQADALAAAVQDLPLLVNQTAAWLAINETMPVETYIERIRSGRPNEFGLSIIDDDYKKSVWTSWSLTQNMLRERHPDAAELLKVFGFFSPDAIPVGLIQSARPGDLPAHLEALTADPIGWHTNLRRLNEATAVMRMDYPAADTALDQGVESVQMHHLYHSYLRSGMPEAEREAAAAAACRVLVSGSPRNPNDTRLWARYAQLIPHLDYAGVFDSADPDVQGLVLDCIEYLRVRGEQSAGLELIQKVLPRWQQRLEPTDRNLLRLDYYHAIMLRRVGRYREAEAAGRNSVALLQVHAPDSNDLLLAKQGLGGSLLALAVYDEARDLFKEVWEAYRGLLGEQHPRTLGGHHNYAAALAQLGHYEQSLAIELDVLQARERVLKLRHPVTLESGTACATRLRSLGRYAEALSRQEQNVRVQRQIMDLYHPQTLRAEHSLALCLRRSGEYQQAESLMRTVLTRSEQVHGPGHPDTLAVLADYATLQRSHGDTGRAKELAASAAAGYASLLGDGHPFSAGVLGNLALAEAEFGDRDESLHMSERALSRMSAAVGARHPWTLGCSLNTSGARALAGDVEGAAELSLATAEAAADVLGALHPLTLSAGAAYATDLRLLRRGKEAGEKEQEVIRGLAETLGDQHPHTVGIRRRFRPYWDFEPQPV